MFTEFLAHIDIKDQDGPTNVFKKLSSVEDEESEVEDAAHAPPASVLHRRRALVPPKNVAEFDRLIQRVGNRTGGMTNQRRTCGHNPCLVSEKRIAARSTGTASEIRFPSRSTLSGPKRSRLGPGTRFLREIAHQNVWFMHDGEPAHFSIAVHNHLHARSDEAHFWLNGYVNKQNCRIWSEANPQVCVETPLHPEKLTVWCALWAGGIIGPYFFKNDEGHNVTVNGDRYRAMITNFFIPELNNHDVQELWFQQDGATCHTARAKIDLLKDTFGDRLISRFGPVNWPPRSCDLTPVDYFLWGYVKSLVYADKPQTLDHLEDNIRRVIADIRPQMLGKVIENWTSRLDYMRASRGSPLPEMIFKICQVIYSQFGLAIHQNDHQARRRFVEWAQNEIAVVPYFHKRILFSDEAHFWLNVYVNKQNCRIWSEANPQVYVETPLHPEKLTVWFALHGLVESFFKNDEGHNVTVNGDRYRAMMTNFFIPELNNHDVQELWFQQDGSTCHTARATIDLFKDTFVDRLISRFGPVNWPPRSCDLTPLDYFLWGYVKSLVYADKPQTLDHWEDDIRRVITDVRPQMLEKVIENWTSRLDYIRARRGSPIPEIIFKINCWEQWTREGTHARKTGSGATRKTTRREDRRIVRQALVDPTVTRSKIRADVGVAIVRQTISRHLAEANLKSKRPFRALPLTPEHQQLRLQWCQARSMWNVTDWQKVVFSDESRFVLGIEDNRVRVWRRPDERYNSPHTVLRHTAHTAGVLVWAAVAYDSRSTLIVMHGTLTGQRYVDDILRPHVGCFLNGLTGAIFLQDNARPHTARVAQDFLRHFQTLPWPARSPICPLWSTYGIR
ncbi:transposable element Tc1 transposase [Trichonephila clavipes]|nr:transposable element Tc1 transposase [Trichonephila clavipes]